MREPAVSIKSRLKQLENELKTAWPELAVENVELDISDPQSLLCTDQVKNWEDIPDSFGLWDDFLPVHELDTGFAGSRAKKLFPIS